MEWQILRSFGQAILAGLCMVYVATAAAQDKKAKQANDDGEARIFIGQPDGSEMKPLVDLGEYRFQSAPVWSADGTKVAFHSYRPGRGEKDADAKIVVVNADGSDPKILGDGEFPSFSPGHQRIVFTRYAPNPGVWVMSSEGPEKELVQLDPGFGVGRWSPDGRKIAYTTTRDMNINMYVYDLIEGDEYPVFAEGGCPYSLFFRNITWSPDGTKIAFKGQRRGEQTSEVVIVDARGAQHGHTVRYETKTLFNVSWNHDGTRILIAQPLASGRMQLFSMNVNGDQAPEILPGLDAKRANTFGVVSPDGKKMLIVSRKPAVELAKEKAKKK